MKIFNSNVAWLKDAIWVSWKAQGGRLHYSLVTCFGHQVTFVGKLQNGVFTQVGVKSPRKWSLLGILAQITEPAPSSQLCSESRGMYKLLLICNMFYSYHSCGIWMLFTGFQITQNCLIRYLKQKLFLNDNNNNKSFRLFATEERWFPAG